MSEPGDVIEKMAREICHYAPLGPSPLNSCCQTDPPMCVQKARACYPIAFNAALERAAAISDTFRCGACGMDGKAAYKILAERVKATP